jgi:GT2 family glycosyltransferase
MVKDSLALLTLSYNCSDKTIKLARLALQCPEINKIIILDNGSEYSDYNELKKEIEKINNKGISLLRSEENLGFSGGFNFIIRKNPSYDFYIFSNADTIIDAKTVKNLLTAHKKYGLSVLTPGVFAHKNNKKTKKLLVNPVKYSMSKKMNFGFFSRARTKSRAGFEKEKGAKLEEKRCFASANVFTFVSLDVLRKIGLLDSNNFFFFGEDADFFYRLNEENIPLYFIPSAQVWHPVSSSSSKESYFLTYNRTRSQIIFFRKHKFYAHLATYMCYFFVKFLLSLFKKNILKGLIKGVKDGFAHRIKENPRL